MIQRLHEGLDISTDLLVQPVRATRRAYPKTRAREGPATLDAPKPETVGKVRMGGNRITAGFPPLRQRKPEPRNPFGAMRLGSAATAPPHC
jgi:hypothetical protein